MKQVGSAANGIAAAVAGLAAGLLFVGILILSPAISGAGWQFSGALLPIALYQAIWCLVEGWIVQTHRPLAVAGHRSHEDRPGFLPLATGIVAAAIAVLAVRETIRSGPAAIEWVAGGYLVGGLGIWLRQISIVQLGEFFRDAIDLAEDHRRVSDGLYACCRHPAELGFALAMTGLLLIGGSPAATILFGAGLVPLILIRVSLENRLLRERFRE